MQDGDASATGPTRSVTVPGAQEVRLVAPEPRGARIVHAGGDEVRLDADSELTSALLPGFASPRAGPLDGPASVRRRSRP